MKLVEEIGGRKFILTVLFVLVVVLDAAFQWGIGWPTLAVLGAGIGVFSLSNAIEKNATKNITSKTIYESPDYPVNVEPGVQGENGPDCECDTGDDCFTGTDNV